jgi:hypothetical protein
MHSPRCAGCTQGTKQAQKKAQDSTQRVARKAKAAVKPIAKSVQRAAPSGGGGLFGRKPGASCQLSCATQVFTPCGQPTVVV